MKLISFIFIFTIASVFFPPQNFVIAQENEEIEYLLSFIAGSDCIFIRNGEEHSAIEARKHLEMKYNHVKKRIKTAEDFINKIATKSSLSRKLYKVSCAGVLLPTKSWLETALSHHRISLENQKKKKPVE